MSDDEEERTTLSSVYVIAKDMQTFARRCTDKNAVLIMVERRTQEIMNIAKGGENGQH